MKKTHLLILGLAFLTTNLFAREPFVPPAQQPHWIVPYEAALQEAQYIKKPLLIFVGTTKSCEECRKFITTICADPEFIAYTKKNFVCTQIPDDPSDSNPVRRYSLKLVEKLNTRDAHSVIIADPNGTRIGELSTHPTSVAEFIKDIQTFVDKAPKNGQGRLKYCDPELLDKEFIPAKTHTTSLPKFSDQPLKGRYFTLMSGVRLHRWETTRSRTHGSFCERSLHTPERALGMRKAVEEGFPGARMTWGWTLGALKDMEPNYVELRKLMVQFHKQYGDEITVWPSTFFADKYNNLEQTQKDLHEGLELVSKMFGNGYRPKSIIAGHMSVENMKYLAKYEGIHVVQGQIWSQFEVDGQDGDGGIIYPYYPSKDHFLKAAQSPRGGDDFVDMVNVDGWTIDFFAGRTIGSGRRNSESRLGIGPLETMGVYGPKYGIDAMMQVADVHYNPETVERNGFGFLTANWELCSMWVGNDYLRNNLKAIREKYPDTQLMTLGDFGELWRKHHPDNSRINLKFVQRGLNMPSLEEGRKSHPGYRYLSDVLKTDHEIRWYFNKDFRFATIQNWKEKGPTLVMDYTRYNQPYKEPSGNVIERHWDILDIINQKQSRPQDKYIPLKQLPSEEQKKILKWYPEVPLE